MTEEHSVQNGYYNNNNNFGMPYGQPQNAAPTQPTHCVRCGGSGLMYDPVRVLKGSKQRYGYINYPAWGCMNCNCKTIAMHTIIEMLNRSKSGWLAAAIMAVVGTFMIVAIALEMGDIEGISSILLTVVICTAFIVPWIYVYGRYARAVSQLKKFQASGVLFIEYSPRLSYYLSR